MKVIDALYEIAQDNKNIAIKLNDFLMKLIGNMSYEELNEGLNSEVEIIEDTPKEDKKIEKLELLQFSDLIDMPNDEIMVVIKDNRNKINEIIKRLNGE